MDKTVSVELTPEQLLAVTAVVGASGFESYDRIKDHLRKHAMPEELVNEMGSVGGIPAALHNAYQTLRHACSESLVVRQRYEVVVDARP